MSSLSFEAFVKGTSLGATGGAQALTGDGQLWNADGPGIGFGQGAAGADIVDDGVSIAASFTRNPNTYTATPVEGTSPVPLPASVLPLGGAVLALGAGATRRRPD